MEIRSLSLSVCLFKLTDVLLLIFRPMSCLMTLNCIHFSCYPFTKQVSMIVIQCSEVKGSARRNNNMCNRLGSSTESSCSFGQVPQQISVSTRKGSCICQEKPWIGHDRQMPFPFLKNGHQTQKALLQLRFTGFQLGTWQTPIVACEQGADGLREVHSEQCFSVVLHTGFTWVPLKILMPSLTVQLSG